MPVPAITIPCRSAQNAVILSYSRDVSSDVWVGAATTLVGAVLGGVISFLVGGQQAREARRQRQEDDVREQRTRSADRRFQAYADFLTRARSFRNAAETYYLQPGHQPSLAEIDSLSQSAIDASALVFLVVESDATFEGCRSAVRALQQARDRNSWRGVGRIRRAVGRTERAARPCYSRVPELREDRTGSQWPDHPLG